MVNKNTGIIQEFGAGIRFFTLLLLGILLGFPGCGRREPDPQLSEQERTEPGGAVSGDVLSGAEAKSIPSACTAASEGGLSRVAPEPVDAVDLGEVREEYDSVLAQITSMHEQMLEANQALSKARREDPGGDFSEKEERIRSLREEMLRLAPRQVRLKRLLSEENDGA